MACGSGSTSRCATRAATRAAELRLARALEAGREDIGYLPARAWAADGLPAFRALLAPFAVTTYPAAQALATGPIARDALPALPDSVVGLALVPAQLRRVLANRPLTTAATFRGLRVRVIDNAQSASDFAALGAEPVQGLFAGEVGAGALPGPARRRRVVAEAGARQQLRGPGAVSDGLRGLPEVPEHRPQRPCVGEAVRGSARRSCARRRATSSPPRRRSRAEEVSQLAQLCRSGVRVVTPSTAQLQALAEGRRAAPSARLDAEGHGRAARAARRRAARRRRRACRRTA